MKHFKMTYNGKPVGVFSEYQLLNGFEDYEWQFIRIEPLTSTLIGKAWRYKYAMRMEYFMPTYFKSLNL
jgi:hypothetical protein